MLGQLLAIARNTFLECVRQPILLVLVLGSGVLQIFNVALSGYSMGYTEPTEVSGDDKMLLEIGLATVLGVATLLAAFLATSVLTREIENKTALTVVSKPVSRPLFILGKYVGVAGAIVVATVIMLVWFQLGIRHEVLSTARDDYDYPVLLFGTGAILLSIGLGAWCNYFYNMVFASTAVMSLAPLSLLGWLMVMLLSKEWEWQAFTTDFKPQITIACGCVLLAMLVLSAIAIAASTRLKQVMTITVCAGIFVLGLLSNYLVGRHAYTNAPIGRILEVEERPAVPTAAFTFTRPGDEVTIRFNTQPKQTLRPGANIYYGPSPNGLLLAVPPQQEYTGDPADNDDTFRWEGPPGIVVKSWDRESMKAVIVNAGGLNVARPPTDRRPDDGPTVDEQQAAADEANQRNPDAFRPTTRIVEIQPEGDFVFLQPTETNAPAALAWSLIPNLQVFWLTDAISQGHPITGRYLVLLIIYAAGQIAALLGLSVLLFQTRDMG